MPMEKTQLPAILGGQWSMKKVWKREEWGIVKQQERLEKSGMEIRRKGGRRERDKLLKSL